MDKIIICIKAGIRAIAAFNECDTFFQRFRSLQSRSNGAESQALKEDDAFKLQSSLQCLQDTLSAMYNFIDQVEWRSHEDSVAELLPKLKAAVYDAEDLLEDFRCYEQKVKIESSAISVEPGDKLFHDVDQDNFKKLTRIKERLDNQFGQLERMGLDQATPRFDRSVRPETTRFSIEPKIFGRDNEIEKLIGLLGVPANNIRGPSRPKRKRSAIHSSASNQVCATLDNNEATIMTSVPVLPIIGMGGVGKTTLAQNICSHPQVKKHFDLIVWICVSDDFDVKRLTKEAIEQFSRKATTKDNLDSLQVDLANSMKKRRCLVVLDDMWAENGELWKTFFAPFKDVVEGSMMLVTTRSEKVANIVRTMDPFLLEGLKDNVFQNFFKQCVFGSDSSYNNPVLERIGEQILTKLKGSPLAAKTLGRLLGMSFDPAHWNMILNSQLWQHRQEATEIMPALRLSYIYLPFHLKRCFSFCAVYPKDYNFEKEDLAEIWVAEGFVEPEHNIPLQQTGCKYFEDLAHLSFFQKLRGKYVIHDLMHDMAQLVSKEECFIIKEKKDLERIPQNVRHLSVLKSRDVKLSDLETLCKQTKLRTLLCNKSLKGKEDSNVMEKWCAELVCMRVMVCASISGLPDSISNMKNLRYLKVSDDCSFDSLPTAFCHLYNLQLLSAMQCRINVIPKGFSSLINLQKFESQALKIDAGLLNSFNLITRDLYLCNLNEISKDQAAKIKLMKKHIFNLTLDWSKGTFQLPEPPGHNVIEVFEAVHPPTNIKSVSIYWYPGEYLPSWFHSSDDPTIIFSSLTEIKVRECPRLSSLEQFLQPSYMPAIKKMMIIDCASLEYVPVERFGGLPSLEKLVVLNCPKINSQHLMAPSLKLLVLTNSGNLGDDIDCRSLKTFSLSRSHLESLTFNREKLPLLTLITIGYCKELETLNGDWPSLEKLLVNNCPKINSQCPLAPSLKMVCLEDSGNLGDDIGCRSLTNLDLSSYHLASLTFNREKVPLLTKLTIRSCKELEILNGDWPSLEELRVHNCPKINSQRPLVSSLKKLVLEDSGNLGDDIDCCSLTTFHLSSYHLESLTFNREKLPLLTDLTIRDCRELETLNGRWPNLNSLSVWLCPLLKWDNGIVLPSSLRRLDLRDCGYFSASCLENLTSLDSLEMAKCKHMEHIPRDLWGCNLKSLQNLAITRCEDLVSIGGPEAIAHIPKVLILHCTKFQEIQQPLSKGY